MFTLLSNLGITDLDHLLAPTLSGPPTSCPQAVKCVAVYRATDGPFSMRERRQKMRESWTGGKVGQEEGKLDRRMDLVSSL